MREWRIVFSRDAWRRVWHMIQVCLLYCLLSSFCSSFTYFLDVVYVISWYSFWMQNDLVQLWAGTNCAACHFEFAHQMSLLFLTACSWKDQSRWFTVNSKRARYTNVRLGSLHNSSIKLQKPSTWPVTNWNKLSTKMYCLGSQWLTL
jgi:hypothetical protein